MHETPDDKKDYDTRVASEVLFAAGLTLAAMLTNEPVFAIAALLPYGLAAQDILRNDSRFGNRKK